MTNEEIKNMFPNNSFTFYGKQYMLQQPVVSHGCQGCCFIGRYDCEKAGRIKMCRPLDVTFSRKFGFDKD